MNGLLSAASPGRKVTFYILSHGMYSLLSGSFEVVLALRLLGTFGKIVLLYLLFHVLLQVGFVIGSLLIRSGRASFGFRGDLVLQVVASVFMMASYQFWGELSVLGVFFALKGLGDGLFWASRHSAVLHSVPDRDRDRWVLGLQSITIVLGVILPVAAGLLISGSGASVSGVPSGYFWVFGLTGLSAAVALVASPVLRIPPQTVRFRASASVVSSPRALAWLLFLLANALEGFVLPIAFGILNFWVLKSEFSLGLFASWIALASAGFYVLFRRFSRGRVLPRIRLVALGSASEFLGNSIYLFSASFLGLAFKSTLDAFLVPLKSLLGENILRRRVDIVASRQRVSVAEAMLFQETVLFVGRLAGGATLWFFLQGTEADPVSIALNCLWGLLVYLVVEFVMLRQIGKDNLRIDQ